MVLFFVSFVRTKAPCALLFGPDSIVKLPVFKHLETFWKDPATYHFWLPLHEEEGTSKSGTVAHTCNSSTWKADAGGLQGVLGHHRFKVSLSLKNSPPPKKPQNKQKTNKNQHPPNQYKTKPETPTNKL